MGTAVVETKAAGEETLSLSPAKNSIRRLAGGLAGQPSPPSCSYEDFLCLPRRS